MKRFLALSLVLAAADFARAYDTIRFLEPIKGSELSQPVAVVAASGRLYVLDGKKNTLLIYNAAGKLVKVSAGSGAKEGQLSDARGIAAAPDGKIVVADTGNSRVSVFDRDGAFLYAFGKKGSDFGQLHSPESVAVGGDGRIYVSDGGNDRIQVFTEEGIRLYQFGHGGKEKGQFRSLGRVNVDAADNIYAFDRGNNRIQKFDANAKFVKEYPAAGNDFAINEFDFLYILDGSSGKVFEESTEGALLGRFGSKGSGPGQFKRASGVSAGAAGEVIVLDTGNSRILRAELTNKLKINPVEPNPAAKLTLVGPSRTWNVAATAIAVLGDALYAAARGGGFVILDANGKVKSKFGSAKGKTSDVNAQVGGIAAAKELGLFASDAARSKLQRFDLDGKWNLNIGEAQGFFDSKKKEGRMISPHGVAINEAGTIYVADTGNRRIDAFGPDGVFLFGIGPNVGTYELREPVDVAFDKAGFLFFVDRGLKKVFKCEPSGAFLAAWGQEGDGAGQFRAPSAIAFDGQNGIYTLDTELKRVSVYDRDGHWITDFFSAGDSVRELSDPVDMTFQDERLVISDAAKGKILSYDLHPRPAAPIEVSTSTKDGIAMLSWTPSEDPWAAGYQVLRSTQLAGPYAVVGSPADARYQDSEVTAGERYWYRVATVSKTKDVGAAGHVVALGVGISINRAPVEISSVTIGNIFAASYKWYLKNPVGKVTITNNVNVPFLNVKVTFKLKDYMDFGFDTEIKKLEPKQSVDIPLIATLNNKVLDVTEDTPIQAEFALNYFEHGEARTATLTKPLRLYSRNAITWNDSRKLANFVTFKDEVVKSLKSAISSEYKSHKAEALNPNVMKAIRIWGMLGEYGVKFAPNPSNPFETAHDDPNFPVDFTQYPRETLKRKTGQCSDLTSLFAALLEDNEVRVAVLDYPGHMTLMFDTETDDPAEAGLPPDQLVEYQGSLWVPMEVTYVGKNFAEAVSKAAYAYKTETEKNRVKIIDLDAAFAEYEPVTMPPANFTPTLPPSLTMEKRWDEAVSALAKERYDFLKKRWKEKLSAGGAEEIDARLGLGGLEYEMGDQSAALEQFTKALALDPKSAAAENNIGSVKFLAGDYAEAQKRFASASALDAQDPNVWLNLVKTSLKLKKTMAAREYGEKAVALAPAFKPFVDGLLSHVKDEEDQ